MYPPKTIAVIGASQNPEKYGYKIMKTLLDAGLEVYGINPKGGAIGKHTFFNSLQAVTGPIDVAILVIPPAGLVQAVEACIEKNIREIWFQPGARDPLAFEKAASAGIQAVNGCFMAENGFW